MHIHSYLLFLYPCIITVRVADLRKTGLKRRNDGIVFYKQRDFHFTNIN